MLVKNALKVKTKIKFQNELKYKVIIGRKRK